MKTKKSAIGFRFIVILIITILFAVIYFVWLTDYRIFGEKMSDYEICKISNKENAMARLKIDNWVLAEVGGNKCKTEYIDVPKDGELKFIADKMAGCWDMYLEGKEELFETQDNVYCAVCSVLRFKEEKELADLTTYLMENEVPSKYLIDNEDFEEGVNYYEYLVRVKVTKESLELVEESEEKYEEENEQLIIDTGKKDQWAVMFVQGKDVNPGSLTGYSSIESAAGGFALGAAGGTLIALGSSLCSGIVTCSVGALFIAIGTGITAYFMGSSFDPDLDSRILLWPYTNDDMSILTCSRLEGKDKLELK